MSEQLKPCPCGELPTELTIGDAGQGGKYATVAGNCCGYWTIEFRTDYWLPNTPKCKARAMRVWNSAPRSKE